MTVNRGLLLLLFISMPVTFLFTSLLVASMDPVGAAEFGEVALGQTELIIATTRGAKFSFTVEIAESPEQQHQGLMFRESLPPDAGMLFLLGTEEIASFWMHNTFLPLDMIFVARDGRITNIHANAAPGSTAIISSTERVTAVLELNAGVTKRHGIHAGDHVLHSAFKK